MKPHRPQKRSVSPFGTVAPLIEDPLAPLREAISKADYLDGAHLPDLIEKVASAPANDAPDLEKLCQFLLRFHETIRAKGLESLLFEAMLGLFEQKTELFMLSSQDEKETVLFARERDYLAGRFFAPFTEAQPGLFSQFITRWMETDNPDRALHFLDFCAGSKNPTFEHYLLFTHPALARVISNKTQLRALFEKAQPLLSKMPSSPWAHDVRAALAV